MKRTLGFFVWLFLLLPAAGCSDEASRAVVDVQVHAIRQPVASSPVLHYFTTSSDGGYSILWRADLAVPRSLTRTLSRERIDGVSHAAGYAPRGAISIDRRTAWTTLPSDRRHGDPAQLWMDGVLVDERALYLQDPLFLGADLFYLRREPGPPRTSPQGKLLQPLDDFSLVRIAPSGAEQVVRSELALWFHLVGAGGQADHLLIQRVDDDGSHLLELTGSGGLVRTHFLGTGPVRDIRKDPSRPDWVTYLRGTGGADGAQILELNLRGPASSRERVLHSGLRGDASPLPLSSGELLLTEQDPLSSSDYSLPIIEVTTGTVLWRDHRADRLIYTLREAGGRTTRLVPPGDAGQDVSLLRAPQ